VGRNNLASSGSVETLNLEMFNNVSAEVGAIRVAVMREGFDGGFERHSNTTQVLLSEPSTPHRSSRAPTARARSPSDSF
jgi:hypothetical protein